MPPNLQLPPAPSLPSREAYTKDLISVAICSAAGPCPICQEDYDKDHAPVLLQLCGHIYGKPCILEWFEEGANTCPLDRKELFASASEVEEWSLVPFNNLSNHNRISGSERGGEIIRRTRRTSAHYLFFSGEIIGVNGALTFEGCRRVIRDLWYHAQLFFCSFRQSMDDLDIMSVSAEVLEDPIHDALPRGIMMPDVAWPLLRSVVRVMLAWQSQAWEEGWEANVPREEMDGWAEELWGVGGVSGGRV
jgi:hypothetical protein